jgi:hypothetical protein
MSLARLQRPGAVSFWSNAVAENGDRDREEITSPLKYGGSRDHIKKKLPQASRVWRPATEWGFGTRAIAKITAATKVPTPDHRPMAINQLMFRVIKPIRAEKNPATPPNKIETTAIFASNTRFQFRGELRRECGKSAVRLC